jgi:glycine cleavage system H protein
MVAIFVALMFVGFVMIDLMVQKVEARRTAYAAVSLAMPVPAPNRFEHWVTVPEGVYLSAGHACARPLQEGTLRAGADPLVARALGAVSRVLLPSPGVRVEAGSTLFRLELKGRAISVPCPVSGRVSAVNVNLEKEPELVARDPYGQGWICSLEQQSPGPMPTALRLGARAALWLAREVARFTEFMTLRLTLDSGLGATSQDGGLPMPGLLAQSDSATWAAFEHEFLGRR